MSEHLLVQWIDGEASLEVYLHMGLSKELMSSA